MLLCWMSVFECWKCVMGDDLWKKMYLLWITVTEFAKKTGDYPSLSATDIKVLALTYQLETENVGTEHLKKEPEKKVLMID